MTPLLPPWPLFQLYSTHAVHSLSSSPCLQGLSAAPQVRPSPLRGPLLFTVGASSCYRLWPDVDLAVAFFLAATRRVTTGTAFDVSATLRDALCKGIVNRFLRRSAGEPRSPRRLVGHSLATPGCPPAPGVTTSQPTSLLCDIVLATILLHKRHAVPILPLAGNYPPRRGAPWTRPPSTTLHQNGTTLPLEPRRLGLPGGRPGTSSSAYGCRETSSWPPT